MCIYISQAQLFSGLFTHNVLGAAKMPVVFYLDLVATRIKPQNHRKSLEMRREPRTSGKARKPLREGRRILEAQAQRGLKCISCDQTPKYSPGTQRQLRGPSRAEPRGCAAPRCPSILQRAGSCSQLHFMHTRWQGANTTVD